MAESVDDNWGMGEVVGRLKVNGEPAEFVRYSEEDIPYIEDQLGIFAELLTETDLKESVFTEGEQRPDLAKYVKEKKVKQIKEHIATGHLLCVRVDGQIAAVQGLEQKTTMPDGRPLMELTKGATHPDYQKNDFAKLLAMALMQDQMKKDKNVIWVGYSRNEIVIESMTKRGFRKELTGSKHPVAVAYTGDPDSEGNAKLRKDRYYVLFLDPTGEYMGDAEEYQKVEEAVQERRKETAEEVGDVVRE